VNLNVISKKKKKNRVLHMGQRTHKGDFHENGFYDFDRTSAICRDRIPKEACIGNVLKKTTVRPL
jgi:hypothetical protein